MMKFQVDIKSLEYHSIIPNNKVFTVIIRFDQDCKDSYLIYAYTEGCQ